MDKGTIGYKWNVYDIKTGKLLVIQTPTPKRKVK